MAIPMFSESGNTTRPLQRLLDVWIYEASKMAHINLQLTDAISNPQLIHTPGSFRNSLVVLPDPKTWVWPLEFYISAYMLRCTLIVISNSG